MKDSERYKCRASVTGLIIGSSPIAGLPCRDVQDIASHSSRRASRTISRVETTIVTVDVSESRSCTEFSNVPTLFVKREAMEGHDGGTNPKGAANEFVAITKVASAKMVEDRWTIDDEKEVKSTSRSQMRSFSG